eukprot:8995148-Pyramimonas_sp.AAC.1
MGAIARKPCTCHVRLATRWQHRSMYVVLTPRRSFSCVTCSCPVHTAPPPPRGQSSDVTLRWLAHSRADGRDEEVGLLA